MDIIIDIIKGLIRFVVIVIIAMAIAVVMSKLNSNKLQKCCVDCKEKSILK